MEVAVVLLIGLFVALVLADGYSVRKNREASDSLRNRKRIGL